MPDVPLTLVKSGSTEIPPSVSAVTEVLADALRGRHVPARRPLATGEWACPDEGLALVQSFLAIRDPEVRQAILDAAAALATTERS